MDLGLVTDFFPGAGFSRTGAGTLEVSSLRLSCRLRWLKVPALGRDCQPTRSDARFFFVLRKRFLNLGGRGRAADQTLASETLVPLRPESGIPDRLTSDECVFPCVGSQPVFPPLQGGMDALTGFPEDALDEADTLEVTVASTECADCGGLRYSLRRDDLQSFCS